VHTSLKATAEPALISVSNCDEIMAIDENSGAEFNNYQLTADIHCTGKTVEPLFSNEDFRGIFNGQGHTISGYQYEEYEIYNTGLFAEADGATFKNLTLKNGSITTDASGNTGVLLGYGHNVTIDNVHSDWSVSSEDNTGGLVGLIETEGASSSIKNSSVMGSVYSSGDRVGGLVGDFQIEQNTNIRVENNFTKDAVYGG
jgi:hypothetical protein